MKSNLTSALIFLYSQSLYYYNHSVLLNQMIKAAMLDLNQANQIPFFYLLYMNSHLCLTYLGRNKCRGTFNMNFNIKS